MAKQYIQATEPFWLAKERKYIASLKANNKQFRRVNKMRQALNRAKRNRREPTEAEAFFRSKLHENGIRFTFEYVCFYTRKKYRIIDFYLPDYKLNIELDGGYHNTPAVKRYDSFKDKRTPHETWRFKNEDIFKDSFWTNFLILLHGKLVPTAII